MITSLKKAIQGLDADYIDIRTEQGESTSMTWLGPVLESIGTKFTLGGCIRACVDGGWGFATFNRPEEAAESARLACRMAELARAEKTELAAVEPVIAEIGDTVSINPADVPLEEKRDLLKAYNDRMLSDSAVVTTKSIYRDTRRTVTIHTSDGSELTKHETYCGVMLAAITKDGSNVQRGFESIGDRRGYETVLNLEAEADQVVKTARDLIKAPKVEGGLYPVILDPRLTGVFTHEAFGHLSEADFVYENPQASEMMTPGRRFGPEILNIVDDGSLAGDNGFLGYDDECVPKGRTPLIENGILTGRLHSRETAGKMGESVTGNARAITADFSPIVRMTATFMENGESTFEDMLEGIESGIYACGALGGMTDLERFTFSSMIAYKIENGKVTTPLRDVILSGNVFETLKNIEMIGGDLQHFGGLGGCGKGGQSPLPVSVGAPHVRIKNVLIG